MVFHTEIVVHPEQDGLLSQTNRRLGLFEHLPS